MAAQPGMQKLEKQVADKGGDDYVFDLIRAGVRPQAIMEEFGFSRTFFYRWVRHGGKERSEAWEQAKRDSADALVEQAQDVLEDPMLNVMPTSAQVSLAGSKSKFLQWLAGKRDRAQYGDDPAVAITLQSMGDMHLQALINHGGALPPLGDGQAAREEIEEAEVLAIESAVPAIQDAAEEFEVDPILADLL